MKKRNAAIFAALLPVAAYVLVVSVLADTVYWNTSVPPGREQRAALAIRDNVTRFQKWGTKVFTEGYLDRYYDGAWYFTQPKKGALKEEFVACLDKALERYPNVDLYLLAHTNEYIEWVAQLPAERRAHLRLVYNTGCHNLPQGPKWLELGAKVFVGHPGQSWSSMFYCYFLRDWTRGATVQEAMDAANVRAETTFRQWEFLTRGKYSAERIIEELTASSNGDAGIRIGEGQG